jgi:hypothetical protein
MKLRTQKDGCLQKTFSPSFRLPASRTTMMSSTPTTETATSTTTTTTTTEATKTTKLIVVAPTFYKSLDESRCRLALEACQQAALQEIRLILIDASPRHAEIATALTDAGMGGPHHDQPYVRVLPQQSLGKKGTALREAIQAACQELDHPPDDPQQSSSPRFWSSSRGSSTGRCIIAFQEPEKVGMIRHWGHIVEYMDDIQADILVPHRSDKYFQRTYPVEQYHCETFANLYLNSLAGKIGLIPTPSLDWTMGPVAFRRDQAHYWLEGCNDCEVWDAQLVPIIRAHMVGRKVATLEIDYHHPTSMKQEEEGDPIWMEKRLLQLNVLSETVGQEMKKAEAVVCFPADYNI